MALLDIEVFGSPILRQETEPVGSVTPALRRLVDDMFDTMHAAQGIGLAAPQVGRRERLAVIEIEGQRLVLINPEIMHSGGGLSRAEEGCLSIPEVYATVERPAQVTVRAQDIDGTPFEVAASELLGRCLQHEIDHLHGKLFLDRLSFLKKRTALKAWDEEKGNYPGLRRVLPVDALPPERS
jgi:peptide deformylase